MIRAEIVITSLQFLTWCWVIFLAVLSLLPAQELVRTSLPGQFEHFIAYAWTAMIATSGYGMGRHTARIIGGLWVYAGVLEYLQHFFARAASVYRGFLSVGTRRNMRWARHPPVRALLG